MFSDPRHELVCVSYVGPIAFMSNGLNRHVFGTICHLCLDSLILSCLICPLLAATLSSLVNNKSPYSRRRRKRDEGKRDLLYFWQSKAQGI